MDLELDKKEKVIAVITSLSFLLSLLSLRFSGFSSSRIVNFYNYIINAVIFSANTNTLAALGVLLEPFIPVAMSLVFLTLSISLLAYCGSQDKSRMVGNMSGAAGAVMAVIIFPTIAGAFLSIAILVCGFYAVGLSGMYSKESKKWTRFRTGSNTAGKLLIIANVLIALGIFSSVLAQQSQYEESFRQELKGSVESLALSLPGASSLPREALEQRIESTANALTESEFFSAYIVWLPVSAAFTAWIILEFLRNLVFANLGGLFTYSMLRGSGKK